MLAFTIHQGLVAPLNRANVDTDAIIPKQFLKSIKRSGFGVNAFDAWRYLDQGEPEMDCTVRPLNPDFILNQARYLGASILLAGENFGCGSSREHAPWALADYGFRAILAVSFADIFYNNCLKNGLLPIILSASEMSQLFALTEANPGFQLTIDLHQQLVITEQLSCHFTIDPFRRDCLLNGWDEIALTLLHSQEIKQFENNRRQKQPWNFPGVENVV